MTYKFDDEHDIEVHHPIGNGPYWARLVHRKTHQTVVRRVESTEGDVESARLDLEQKLSAELGRIS